ncbi:hypothetical protein O181_088119 [Austropuccinia psidii MF-1]|uniref:Reverse transcriptase Ty1/copia-type domain-containing protein n=1 Tax=Austropuccinia psidii MF-1 TaxID=1389203 RepID=A0A9Q3P2Z5_9BASI|nr:hypothetical protein [Austropuccinia psidii MF-1]
MGNYDGFKFDQTELIDKVTSLSPSNVTASTPLPFHCVLVSNTSKEIDKEYLKRAGMLLYIAQGTKPNISYEVNFLARYFMGPDNSHWEALENLISYLHKTSTFGIQISHTKEKPSLDCFVDSNWGGEGNRSTHGYLLMHGKNPIMCKFKRQETIVASVAQAVYMALSFAAKEELWLFNMFQPFLNIPCP